MALRAPYPASSTSPAPSRLARAGLATFFRIAAEWGLDTAQQMVLLGVPSRTTFFRWKKVVARFAAAGHARAALARFRDLQESPDPSPRRSGGNLDPSAERRAALRGTPSARPHDARRRRTLSRPRVSRRRAGRRLCLSGRRGATRASCRSRRPPIGRFPSGESIGRARCASSRASSRRPTSSSVSPLAPISMPCTRSRTRSIRGYARPAAERRRSARTSASSARARRTSWRRSRTSLRTEAGSATARSASSTRRSASRSRSRRRGTIESDSCARRTKRRASSTCACCR